MIKKFNSAILGVKDKLVSSVISKAIEYYIEEFCETLDIKINSKNRVILVKILLKGEKETLKVKISRCLIKKKSKKYYFKFKDISTSKEWIDLIIKKINLKEVEIPKIAAKLLPVII